MKKDIQKLLKRNNLGCKVDLGCGRNKQSGFIGLDIISFSDVDIVHDLEKFPWPLPNESVSFMIASRLVNYIDPKKFILFMNEAWRVLKNEGQFVMSMSYSGSKGDFQDPLHVNHINEATWRYFSPLDTSGLYSVHEPMPWRIVKCSYDITGNLEVALEKIEDDKKYHEKKS
jgi:hypothetical protein